MTLIAITQRTEFITSLQEERDTLDQRWITLLEQCQLTPLIMPNHVASAQSLVSIASPQGILLTGGNDSPERMATEHFLMEYAIAKRLPLLGVCHGMQVIQQFFGVQLKAVKGHVMPSQMITMNDETIEVNSFHELGTHDTVPELSVWAQAQDGIVKAVKHHQFPIIGIMWHPERVHPFHARDIKLIQSIYSGEVECEPLY